MSFASDSTAIDRASQRLDVMSRVVGLDVPEACREGVRANLVLLDSHAERLAGFVQDETLTPAPKFHP